MSAILVVDDDELVRELVAHQLGAAGHDVVCANDGEEGLAAAFDRPFDLVLLDSMMPRLSGVDVCRRLRADARTCTARIVMLTARSQEHDVQRGFAAGADDYMAKPFSPRELVSRVAAVLGRSAGGGTPLPTPEPLHTTFAALREQARASLPEGAPALTAYLRVLLEVEVAADDARERYEQELAGLQARLDEARRTMEHTDSEDR